MNGRPVKPTTAGPVPYEKGPAFPPALSQAGQHDRGSPENEGYTMPRFIPPALFNIGDGGTQV